MNYPLAKSLNSKVTESVSPYMAIPQYGKFAPELKEVGRPARPIGISPPTSGLASIGVALVTMAVVGFVGYYMYKRMKDRR